MPETNQNARPHGAPVYYGPMACCGEVHGSWQVCGEPALQAAARRYAAAAAAWDAVSEEDHAADHAAHAAMQEARDALRLAALAVGASRQPSAADAAPTPPQRRASTRTPLAYDADVGETLNAYLACAVARVTGDGYDQARHAATKRALDALLHALCRDRARMDLLCDWFRGGNELVIASTLELVHRRDTEHSPLGVRDRLWVYAGELPRDGVTDETVRDALDAVMSEAAYQADLAAMRRDDANAPADVRACVADRFEADAGGADAFVPLRLEAWPPKQNGCAPRPMGSDVVTALQAWYEEKRRTGYDGPGPEEDLYRAVEAAIGRDEAMRGRDDA